MASRMYFSRVSSGVTPTQQGAWDDTAGLTRGSLSRTKDVNADAIISRAETNASATWDVLLGQWIGAPLDTAQTISGTFDMAISALESNADAEMFLHVHVWVSQGDTSTPRGTLLTDYIDTHELPTTEAGVAITQQTLSSVSASVGDRIIVEVGYQAQNSITTSRTGRVRHGSNDATDQSAGDTTNSHPGWCEFGNTITDAETRVDWQQKWYLGASSEDATAIPPLIRGGWTTTTSVTTTGADALKTTTPGAASSAVSLIMGGTTPRTRALKIFVSPPLNAGTIPASTYHITGLVKENATDQDVVWAVHLYLMAANGDVRATLLNLQSDADADNEWPTTEAGRQSDGFAIASQAITQDDRLVLEAGGRMISTPAANGNIQLRQGGTGADASVSDTDTTHPTWMGIVPDATPRRTSPIWVGI